MNHCIMVGMSKSCRRCGLPEQRTAAKFKQCMSSQMQATMHARMLLDRLLDCGPSWRQLRSMLAVWLCKGRQG